MSKSDSTAPGFAGKSDKPSKPYPEFPLFPHATKRWAKKIRGQMHYFGPWGDPDGALAKYLEQKDALHAGKKPREASEGVTVKVLANAYLNHKQALLDAGELSPRTMVNYRESAELVVSRFGKARLVADLGQDDFAELRKWMAKKWGPVRLGDFIQRIRSIFKYGYDAELLDVPMRFGPGFDRPKKKTLRLHRAAKGPKMFEAAEILAMVNGATVQQGKGKGRPVLVKPTPAMKAMILLGVNCGFGNADCGTLPLAAVDLDEGWISYHRPKTGVQRKCPLWPETVAALRVVLAERKKPKDPADEGLFFITYKRESWHKDRDRNPISGEMRKLLNSLQIDSDKEEGKRGFYALRHTFETIGGESRDQVAVDHIMGHARDDMASVYRERISDERLKSVSDQVRKWLFGDTSNEPVRGASEMPKKKKAG
jgi:integrase